MAALQGGPIGQDVTEGVVVIGGTQGNMGQGGVVCVVPATVQSHIRVGLTHVHMVLTSGDGGCVRVTRWGRGGKGWIVC